MSVPLPNDDRTGFIRRVDQKSYEQMAKEYREAVELSEEFFKWCGPMVPFCEFADLVEMWKRHKK